MGFRDIIEKHVTEPFWELVDPQRAMVHKIIKDNDFAFKGLLSELQRIQNEGGNRSINMIGALSTNAPPDVVRRLITLDIALNEAYLQNTIVAACVDYICTQVSSIDIVLKERKKDGTVLVLDDHPAIRRLRNPNSYQTGTEFTKTSVSHCLLAGNSLIYKNRDHSLSPSAKAIADRLNASGKRIDDGPVKELLVFNPDDFDTEVRNNRIIKYIVKTDIWDKFRDRYPKRLFTADEIIHFKGMPDPTQPYWGMGKIQAAAKTIDVDNKIITWWLNSLINGCRKDLILKLTSSNTNPQKIARTRALMDQQLQGFMHGRSWMLLDREVDIVQANQDPGGFDFQTEHINNTNDICGAFALPGILLGFRGGPYNDRDSASLNFWETNALPMCEERAEKLSKEYLIEYDDLKGRDVWLTYDSSKIDALVTKNKNVAEMVKEWWKMGMPMKSIVEIFEITCTPFPGWDESYIDANVLSNTERQKKMDLAERGIRVTEKTLEHNQSEDELDRKENITNSRRQARQQNQNTLNPDQVNSTNNISNNSRNITGKE